MLEFELEGLEMANNTGSPSVNLNNIQTFRLMLETPLQLSLPWRQTTFYRQKDQIKPSARRRENPALMSTSAMTVTKTRRVMQGLKTDRLFSLAFDK